MESCFLTLPFGQAFPGCLLELMLDEKQPHADGRCQNDDRQLNEHKQLETDQPDQCGCGQGNSNIRAHGAQPRLPAASHHAERQAVIKQKQICGANTKHHQWVPVCPVFCAFPERSLPVFINRDRIDFTKSAMVETTGAGVMQGVAALPVSIRRECQHTKNAADPVVGPRIAEERTVAAIMLDHEQANQKHGSWQTKDQANPITLGNEHGNECPKSHKGKDRDGDLENTSPIAGVTVF